MNTEKKRRFCRFDVLLLILVLALGAAAWLLMRSSGTTVNTISSAQLLEDLQRSSDRNTKQEELTKVEYYNIDYIVELTGVSAEEQASLPEAGEELFEFYSGCSVGTLQECASAENADGTFDAELTIRLYALFTKLKVTTPAGTLIRVGAPLELRTASEQKLKAGTITWISH